MEFTKGCNEYVRRVANEIEAIRNGDVTEEDGPADLWEYLEDALDVEYITDSRLNYSGARIYVTLGGPTVWIDTDADGGTVQLRWGVDSAACCLSIDARDEIDSIMEEFYNSMRGAC